MDIIGNIIEIENLHIAFGNKVVVNHSNIEIETGKTTAIIGDSGSGKTATLYAIGLVSSMKDYDYYLEDKKIDIDNDRIKSDIRKKKIGFIFQDNNLIEDLTIVDNVKLSSRLSGEELNNSDIESLFSKTDLDLDLQVYVRNLSGGERQRVAIICALAKKPDIIIADEPTSALDDENIELLLSIFDKFLKDEGKAVVIASHDERLYNKCDNIYSITDKRIIKTSGSKKNSDSRCFEPQHKNQDKINVFSLSFYINYLMKIKTKTKLVKNLSAIFCALAISFFAALFYSGVNSKKVIEKSIENSISKEIVIINETVPKNQFSTDKAYQFNDRFLSFSKESLSKINNINNIFSVYEYFQFYSHGYLPRGDNDNYLFSFDSDNYYQEISEISVIQNQKEVSKSKFDYSFMDENSVQEEYSVIPYTTEENFENLVKSADKNVLDGIYITESLANRLGLSSINSTELLLDIYVPTLQYTDNFEIIHGGTDSAGRVSETEPISYEGKQTINIRTLKQFKVSGIIYDFAITRNLSPNDFNYYIFIPYNDAISLINENADNLYNPINKYDKDFEVEKWSPSALKIFVSDFSKINETADEIEAISDNTVASLTYQSLDYSKNIIEDENKTTTLITAVAFIILLLLLALLFVTEVMKRRYEISILRAFGFSKKEINILFMLDALFFLIKIVVLSLVFSTVIYYTGKISAFTIDLNLLLILVLGGIISVFLPYLISLFSINKLSPDEIIRD